MVANFAKMKSKDRQNFKETSYFLALRFLLIGTEGRDPCLQIILFLSSLQYLSNPKTPVCTFTAELWTGGANG